MNDAKTSWPMCALAKTQDSLRRLSLLIAQGATPDGMFAAVTREALHHFGNGTARMIRFEVDGTATLLANEGTVGSHVTVGMPWDGYPPNGLTATVRRTGGPARVDDYRDILGGEPYVAEGLLCAVGMPIHVHGRLWGMMAVGSDVRPLPADTEQRMGEFTDLLAMTVAHAQSHTELLSSRARFVTAADEARRRIERDLHDGAQHRLITLALRLGVAAQDQATHDTARAAIADVASELVEVIDNLRELARGAYPVVLSTAGLGPALRVLRRRSLVPVDMRVQLDERLPKTIEAGAYHVVCEVLTNAAKHARASLIDVDVRCVGKTLRIRVTDNGIGGADPARGSGLIGLRERTEILRGTIEIHSPLGVGTTVLCELPVAMQPGTSD